MFQAFAIKILPLDETVAKAYDNMRQLRVVGSYYRTDIGHTLWPPGVG
ncbi:MAG TPA: hypothetical protein VG347_20400 [Verrucomicrobiae bacterium]|nr:hypothetical protein [Verrucomicrobiae bacterium]